jgi:hypothetical protein
MNWIRGSSGKQPAFQGQSPEFKPHSPTPPPQKCKHSREGLENATLGNLINEDILPSPSHTST